MTETEKLCRETGLGEEETAAALAEIERYPDETDFYAAKMRRGKVAVLKKRSAAFRLAVTLKGALLARDEYRARGIDDCVFRDTFSDIAVWCGNDRARYGEIGLHNVGWLRKHVSLRLFKIGRLQYEFGRFVAPPFGGVANFLRTLPLTGRKTLNLHIQQGAPLTPSACDDSFASARAFFASHYPGFSPVAFTICSWVVNPHLAQVVGEDANTVRFGRRFTLLGAFPDTDMNTRRLFGYGTPREEYTGDNALRAYALSRLGEGKPLLSYFGYIRLK